MQAFYTFDLIKTNSKPAKFDLSRALFNAGIQYGKMLTFPMARNMFMLRVENLVSWNETLEVDIHAIGMALWQEANFHNPVDVDSLTIKETSLTGNMEISEMQKRKIQWKTMDDRKLRFAEVQD